ncbi:MAG: hypothetical protein ACD_19C00176G0057 [uncultured bacterium]|nr:MAG: hypothetical protein ACD_19C00176G0057 [uncultured bacterium]HBY01674.1 antitoxin [Rikenellaceae bacterium]
MTTVSISQLKVNPMAVFSSAIDFPIQIQNRNKTAGYFVGKDLFEKMINYMEDVEDKKTIKSINLDDKTDFEDFVATLEI